MHRLIACEALCTARCTLSKFAYVLTSRNFYSRMCRKWYNGEPSGTSNRYNGSKITWCEFSMSETICRVAHSWVLIHSWYESLHEKTIRVKNCFRRKSRKRKKAVQKRGARGFASLLFSLPEQFLSLYIFYEKKFSPEGSFSHATTHIKMTYDSLLVGYDIINKKCCSLRMRYEQFGRVFMMYKSAQHVLLCSFLFLAWQVVVVPPTLPLLIGSAGLAVSVLKKKKKLLARVMFSGLLLGLDNCVMAVHVVLFQENLLLLGG